MRRNIEGRPETMSTPEEGKESTFHQAGTVFQAELGSQNVGVYTTPVEALTAIHKVNPEARKFDGVFRVDSIQPGEYHIQPTTLYTRDREKASALREQLAE